MKLKSLFLASLAAMAMVSCSNDNDPINADGGNGEKNALVQFSMSFPAGAMTKATDVNLPAEQEFTNLNFYIKYKNEVQVETFTKSNFTATGNTYTLDATIVAKAAEGVTYYVVMNPDNAGLPTSTTPKFNEVIDGGYDKSMDALLDNIAESNKFVMTGSSTGNILANQINNVTVRVSRVAAKLQEQTPTTPFTVAGKSASDGATLKIRFDNYTYANLNTKANLFGNDPYTTNATYFQALANSPLFSAYHAKAIGAAPNNITYCMANAATTPTQVIYQATALWDGEIQGATFYVYKDIAYRTFDKLNTGYGPVDLSAHPISLSEASTAAQFAKYGIQKFVDGKCYYIQDIKTTAESTTTSTIARNNVYQLTVTSVSSWGLPEVIPPTPAMQTLLTLQVVQDPWTVNVNNFPL